MPPIIVLFLWALVVCGSLACSRPTPSTAAHCQSATSSVAPVASATLSFRRSIADRRRLVGGDAASDPQHLQRKLMIAVNDFVTSNNSELREQFDASFRQLPRLSVRLGHVLQLRSRSLNAQIAASAPQAVASIGPNFTFALATDPQSFVETALSSTLLVDMVHSLGLTTEQAASYATFFKAARPSLGRSDGDTFVVQYGETDTLILKFARTPNGIPFASDLEWWTASPVAPTPSDSGDPAE